MVIINNCIDMCERCERIPYFVITGGDPILHPHFWTILEILHNKGIKFSILGNPFHLSQQVCERLHTLGCQKYQLSLDGLEYTHDTIRKIGSYRETLKKIPIIRKTGIMCTIMTTVSTVNYLELPQIIDVVVENRVDIFSFARYCPASDDKSLMVPAIEYRKLLDECWKRFEVYRNSSTIFNLKDHLWTLYLYEKGLFKIDDSLKKDVIFEGCSCGIEHLTILPDGTLYACRRMESPVGNALIDSIFDVFFDGKMNEYRQFEKFEKCSNCELLRFCRGCPATAYAIKGNMYSPDPQCWKN